MPTKIQVARHQLGIATMLFIKNFDPISVHCLACGAGGLLEGVAMHNDIEPFSSHILETHPQLDIATVRILRNKYWNAFKHFYDRNNKGPRDDEEDLEDFSDEQNDHFLYIAWHDYQAITGKLTIEVQIFQIWYYAMYEEKIVKEFDMTKVFRIFSMLKGSDRARQKSQLNRTVEKYKNNPKVLGDPRTESGILGPKARN